MVVCYDESGHEVARGLVNYPAHESAKLLGHPSSQIESILGYVDDESLIHRDNLVLTD
jgi:glutamate 5-kinase